MASDPKAGAPEHDPYEADEAEAAESLGEGAFDLEALRLRGDMEGLLALAKAYRSGTAPGGRDLTRCLAAYRAAAELGSAEAEYAVALFHMNGGTVVAQDLKEGATRLRAAADKGSVPAKVYLGNLYELGIHYKADAEKADVWYRNAGRAAHVEAEQGTDEWTRALADLGCARHVLLLTGAPGVTEDDKARLLARAKAHGYGLRVRDELADATDRATFVDALTGAEGAGMTAGAPGDAARRERKDTSPETKQAKQRIEESRAGGRGGAEAASGGAAQAALDPAAKAAAEKAERIARAKAAERNARVKTALAAFAYTLLFVLAGLGAGYAATLGARELVAHGHKLPGLGTNTRAVFPIVLGVVGVLPATLVYRFGTVLKGLVLGAAVGGVGWVAWGTGSGAFHGERALQALAFGLGGFLAALFVLGLLGGAKQPRNLPRRPP
jgi:hypothetical protein